MDLPGSGNPPSYLPLPRMSRLRALAKESLAYGVSSLLSRFLNFLLVPFYTHVLTPGEFGVSNIVFALVAFLNIVYQAGFDSSYLRLAHDAANAGEEKGRKLFSTALWSQAAVSLACTAPFLIAAPWLGAAFNVPVQYGPLFAMAALILGLDALAVVPMAHLRYRHKAMHFALIRLGSVVVNIAGNLVFVLWLKRGLEGIFLANVIASALTLALLLPVFLENLRATYDTARLRTLLVFGLPFVPAGLYGIVNEMAGRLFLSRLSPEDVGRLYPGSGWDTLHLTGVFSAAWKLGIFGLLLVQMYRLAWQPFFLRHHGDADASVLFGRILRALLLFVGGCGLALTLFLDKLVAFPVFGKPLIAPAFWPGLPIVPGILLAYALQAWCVHFTLGVYIAKKTSSLVWINGAGALVTVAFSVWLVPLLGLWGAVWGAVACYAVMAVLMTRTSQALYRIDLDWPRLLPLFLWMALCFAVGFRVQAHPETGFGTRVGLLAGGLLLPFLIGAVRWREVRPLLPLGKNRGKGKAQPPESQEVLKDKAQGSV
jgi:O-antigen/teichoic acid export membrane protein